MGDIKSKISYQGNVSRDSFLWEKHQQARLANETTYFCPYSHIPYVSSHRTSALTLCIKFTMIWKASHEVFHIFLKDDLFSQLTTS